MKKIHLIIGIIILSLFVMEYSYAQDWANLNHYKNKNAKIGLPSPKENRIVFIGNSITESWGNINPEFFVKKSYVNRGIGGQTTPQILLRFKTDAIDLKPKVIVILAGTNDIAENTGPITLEKINKNIISMAELAKKNDIIVILSSVLPAFDYPWKPGLQPAEKIVALNGMIKSYADKNEIIYLDYYSAMVDKRKGLKDAYTYDGVHPNKAGYQVMTPLAEKAIARALKSSF